MLHSTRFSITQITSLLNAVLLFVIFSSCRIFALNPDSIRPALPPLGNPSSESEKWIADYCNQYGFNTIPAARTSGTFQSDSFICVGHVFTPNHSKGTVYFLHGLFDHSGTIVNGIRECVNRQFTVAAMDLPGHGLSNGERGAINDFSEYVKAFSEFVRINSSVVDTPVFFIGHSTGCAVGYEYLITSESCPFVKFIFLAPLVRTSYYHLSVFGNTILKPFLRTTPRWFRKASHDKEFLRQFRKDPLQPHRFPVRWADAYYQWFAGIREAPVQSIPLAVIQGTADDVVDWRFNIPFLKEKFSSPSVIMIDDARHQLLNESKEYYVQLIKALAIQLNELGAASPK